MRKPLALAAAVLSAILFAVTIYLYSHYGNLIREAAQTRMRVEWIDLDSGSKPPTLTGQERRPEELRARARTALTFSTFTLSGAFVGGITCILLLMRRGKKEESIYNRLKNR